MNLNLDQYKNSHAGQRAYIVGKGPSLDTIQSSPAPFEMEGGVVFCLNESIHKIEALGMDLEFQTPIYCVQQDSELERRCIPARSTHFQNSWMHSPDNPSKHYVEKSPWNPNAVLYRYPEYHLSAVVALDIIKLMGMNDVTFCCFDSWMNDATGSLKYADCIGIQREGNHYAARSAILIKARDLGFKISTISPLVVL